jgi:hypothetical protein
LNPAEKQQFPGDLGGSDSKEPPRSEPGESDKCPKPGRRAKFRAEFPEPPAAGHGRETAPVESAEVLALRQAIEGVATRLFSRHEAEDDPHAIAVEIGALSATQDPHVVAAYLASVVERQRMEGRHEDAAAVLLLAAVQMRERELRLAATLALANEEGGHEP